MLPDTRTSHIRAHKYTSTIRRSLLALAPMFIGYTICPSGVAVANQHLFASYPIVIFFFFFGVFSLGCCLFTTTYHNGELKVSFSSAVLLPLCCVSARHLRPLSLANSAVCLAHASPSVRNSGTDRNRWSSYPLQPCATHEYFFSSHLEPYACLLCTTL